MPLGGLTKCVIANPNISNSGGRVLIVFRRVSTDGVTSAKLLTYEEPGFRNTPTKQLVRAAVVLKLSSFDFLVKHADTLFSLGRSVLGEKLFRSLMTATFYGQFCPGKTYDEINEATYAMQEAGIIPLLAVPTEEDSKNDVD
uniref:Proline dehydrogenase n=1 Tax=Ciona savignyi TaxID=51511 RepID=H2ZL40_CIOSA